MRNKFFTRIIITTLLCTFLTFNVGKVTRVSAIGTTAAIAGTAFILTGAVYMSYIALTQGQLVLPAAEEMHNWLGSIGKKVSQYPSGAEAYQDIYQKIAREPFTGVIDDVWTWTQDRLKSFANDFSDTRIISEIVEYTEDVDTTYYPTNGFAYPNYKVLDLVADGKPFSYYTSQGYTITPVGDILALVQTTPNQVVVYSSLSGVYRNLKHRDGTYEIQKYVNGQWVVPDREYWYDGYFMNGNGQSKQLKPYIGINQYYIDNPSMTYFFSNTSAYPLLTNCVIHDEATDQDLPMVIPDSQRVQLPSWNDPDNDNRPIIPWVPLPQLPVNVTPPTGYVSPQWGFNLQDLLDKLEDLAGTLMNIGAIEALINGFAGLHGDEYYLYYTEGDTNYYTYYQPTIYDNDTEYITYNIDVSHVDEQLPVDLNTISLYTNNRYLDELKRASQNGGSLLRDYIVFWYDVAPDVVYLIGGGFIGLILAAFVGKWGHS